MNKFKREIDQEGEYKDYLKSPAELRKELGISEHYTTQRRSAEARKRLKAKHDKFRKALRPLRRARLAELQELKDKGFSTQQIASSIISGRRRATGVKKFTLKQKQKNKK